jgi:hypothetical protein
LSGLIPKTGIGTAAEHRRSDFGTFSATFNDSRLDLLEVSGCAFDLSVLAGAEANATIVPWLS